MPSARSPGASWRHGPALSRAEIAALFAGALAGDLLAETLDRLESLALVLPGADDRLVVPAAVRGMLLGNRTEPRPASTLLAGLSGNVLNLIAGALAVVPARRSKEAKLAAVVAALEDQAALRERIAALTDTERAVLDYAVDNGGVANPYEATRRVPAALPGAKSQYGQVFYLRESSKNLSAPLLQLQLLGLLVAYPTGYPSALVVPDEVMTALRPLPGRPDPAEFVEPPLLPPPDARPAGGAPAPVLDLLDTLRFAAETGLALTKKGALPKPQRARLQKYLLAPDAIYPDFLFALALRAGLLHASPNLDWVVQVDEEVLANLLPIPDPLWRLTLLAMWLDLPAWRDGDAEPNQRDDPWLATSPAQRRVALRLFAALPADGASLDSLAALLRFRYPRAFQEDGPASMHGVLPSTRELLRGVVQVLAWLGFGEPLTSPERPSTPSETIGVRLNDLGREIMRIALEADAATVEMGDQIDAALQRIETTPRTDRVVVQPTLEVLAPPNIGPRVYYDLRRFTDLTRSGGVRTLTVTATSLRRAFDAGIAPQSVRSFLEQHSGGPVPSTLASLLGEAAARYGRIHVGGARLYLTVDEPALLAELQADRRLKGVTLRALAPTVAVAEGGALPDLLAKLRDAGYMPVSDDDKRRSRDPLRGDAASRRSKNGRIVAFPGVALDDEAEETLPAGKKVTAVSAIDAALRQALKRGEQVEIGYRRGGDPTAAPMTHKLSVIELKPGEVYGRCWLCGTSIRFKTARIAWARPTGEADPG